MEEKNLTLEQISRLQKALKWSDNAHVRERILIYMLHAEGKTISWIVQFLGCELITAEYWIKNGDPDQLDRFYR